MPKPHRFITKRAAEFTSRDTGEVIPYYQFFYLPDGEVPVKVKCTEKQFHQIPDMPMGQPIHIDFDVVPYGNDLKPTLIAVKPLQQQR